jgi:O-antigen/teichoic acid export membrane protein
LPYLAPRRHAKQDNLIVFLRRLRSAIPANGFVRNAGVLSIGTLVAQAVTFLFYPLLTRVYGPQEFGAVAVVYMLSSLLAIIASGSAESAILVARSRRSAAHVIGWILRRSALVLGTASVMAIIAATGVSAEWLESAVRPWLPAIPAIAATTVVFNCYSEWSVRERQFGELARYRIVQSAAVASFRSVLGVLSLPFNGLIAGEVIGKLLSALSGARSIFFANSRYFRAISLRRIRMERERFRRFPRYMMPDQLINTAGGTIHVPFIGAAFGSSELGFVSITFSALYLPVTVVSTAIKDVFRQRAAVDYQLTGSCRAIYLRLLLPVTAIGVAGFGLLYWWSPWLFTFVFGSGWAPVGEYARILIPMFFMNFVSMSMGGVLVVTHRLGVSLGWQVANLCITVAALAAGVAYFRSIEATLWAFTVAKAMSYGLYMVLSYYYAGKLVGDDASRATRA